MGAGAEAGGGMGTVAARLLDPERRRGNRNKIGPQDELSKQASRAGRGLARKPKPEEPSRGLRRGAGPGALTTCDIGGHYGRRSTHDGRDTPGGLGGTVGDCGRPEATARRPRRSPAGGPR